MRGLALIGMMLCGPAAAQEVVATLQSNNGTLPPPYHQSLRVTVTADGMVTLRACRGYEDSDDGCRTFTGRAPAGALEGIAAAASAADIAARPPGEDPMPPVGGGSTSGSVTIDGQRVILPPFPLAEDRARTEAVLAAIRAAVPPEVQAGADKALAD